MAKIIKPPYFQDVVNAGEKRLLNYLEINLPEDYILIPNIEIASTNPRNQRTQYWEYDLVVVAPHAIYNIENKDWKGRIEGNDDYWYVNDRQKPNPLKTNRQKTAILASKLKEANFNWGKAWINNLVTLSYPNSFEPLLWLEAGKLSFTLTNKLIDFIREPEKDDQNKNSIVNIQNDIVQFLIGNQSKKAANEKKEVEGYEIIEILQQEPNYVEYLVKPKGVTSSIRKRVKEYSLQVAGLSPNELKQREESILNQFNALKKIRVNPFILNVEFKLDEENHLFYEITDFLDENSLRAEARNKTFTFEEKINLIKNIMSALKEAHEVNIFHRDVNPDNIYLNNGYAYLGNFGKSYFTDHNEIGYTVMATINESNATAYHPYELIAKDASRASDIYSLGVLIYWLFTGSEPIKNPWELDKLGGVLPKDLLPSAINAALPKWLDELCLQTIVTDDTARIESIYAIESFINDAVKEQSSIAVIKKDKPILEVDSYDLKEGDRVGDYIIHKTLGRGGYSRVFKVKHNLQGEDYALKLFNDSVNISSVMDEYNALIKLSHPNIVKFIWNGTTPNGQFFTLTEFLDGETLSIYTKTDASLSVARIYKLGEDILSALVMMQSQEKPLLHRDIKPQNIIWDKQDRFVLIDFNVASFSPDNKDFVGTNPYLAPDLIEGHNINWNLSADTFALGITLFELVCKQYPWAPGKMPQLSKAPANPKELQPRLSQDFSDFLLKAIATNSEGRFESAKAMLKALILIGEDNLLEENKASAQEAVNTDQLYHVEVFIAQNSFSMKLFDKMSKYSEIRNTVLSSLNKFKDKIQGYKNAISFEDKLKFLVKVDSEVLISETFWNGGARNFNEGNIERVYKALKDAFEENTNRLKEHKIDVEGIDIVDYVNSLFSQSKSGNWGTRVNDRASKYDELTYSPSKLDRKLIPDILDARFKLIIITGNAGDGKTAFIRTIEDNNSVKELKRYGHKNGAKFKINDVGFESNYDGSQDENDKVNNEVLESFFKPFEGLSNYNDSKEGRIIAINEGRLVEFLKTSQKYKHLHDTIDQYFYNEGHFVLPNGLMIVNLNLRSVTAISNNESSLFRQQVKALTNKSLWSKCNGCPIANKCFIKYNVDTFNDIASGDEIITRMEWLLRTVGLKRELHITMRDLRSFISFMLTRDYGCQDVEDLLDKNNSAPDFFWQLFYFNITNPLLDDAGNKDRLIKLLRETDIGSVAIPDLDRDLFFGQHIQRNYIEFSDRKWNLFDDFNNHKIWAPAHEQTEELINKIKSIQKIFVRHQYFEGRINEYQKRIPYQSLHPFYKALNASEVVDYSNIKLNYSTNTAGDKEKILKFNETELQNKINFTKSFMKRVKEIVQFENKGIKNLIISNLYSQYNQEIVFETYKGCSWTDFKRVLNVEKIKKTLPLIYQKITVNTLLNLKMSISQAISMNEGCENEKIWQENLVLSSSEISDPISKSFRLFRLNDFELFINRTDHLVKYLEYEPDSLVFRHKKETHIQLVISLDLFEMLYFIQQGYSPSLNDLRGRFIELTIFKNLLENLTYNEVVVTKDNMEFYKISKDVNNHLCIESMKF